MKPCAICIHYANREPRRIEVSVTLHYVLLLLLTVLLVSVQFLETDTALRIVGCVPLLICNGIVLVYFVVRGVHALVLRLQKKVQCVHRTMIDW